MSKSCSTRGGILMSRLERNELDVRHYDDILDAFERKGLRNTRPRRAIAEKLAQLSPARE